MADSRVIIDSKLENRGIIKGVRDAARQFQHLADEYKKTSGAIKEQEAAVSDLKLEYDKVAEAVEKMQPPDPARLKELTKELDKIMSGEKEPRSLKNMREEAAALEKDLKAVETANKDLIAEYEKAVGLLENLMETGFKGEDLSEATKEVDRLAEKLRPTDDKMDAIRGSADALKRAMADIKLDPSVSEEAQNLREAISELEASAEANKIRDAFTEAEAELANLHQRAENIQKSMDGLHKSSVFGFADQATQAQEDINTFEDALQRLYDQLAEEQDPATIVALRHEIQATEEAFDKFTDGLSQPVADIMRIKEVESGLESARNKVAELQSQFEQAKADGDPLGIARLAIALNNAKNEAGMLEAELRKLQDADIGISQEGAERARTSFESIGKAAQATAKKAVDALRRIGSGVASIAKGAAGAARGLSRMVRNLLGIDRSSRRASGGLERMWRRMRRIAVTALVFSVIRRALNGLTRDLGRVLMANDQFADSWNKIRVNLLTAFAPLWEVIQPAILNFMQLLAQFTAVLAQFMATLFGRTIQQARASARGLHEQAKGLEAVGGAASDARKQLAGFDELNVLSDNSGGGGGGADALDFDFEPPDVSWIDEFAEKLRKFFSEEDFEYWFDLGAEGALRFARALYAIPWDSIREGARTAGENLAGLLGGFLSSDDAWEALGHTLAQGLNTALDFLHSFARRFPWRNVGRAVGRGINSFIRTFDWKLAARTFNEWSKGILDLLIESLITVDWADLGVRLGELLNNIDWRGILTRYGRFAGEIVNAITDIVGNFARTTDWKELGLSIAAGIMSFFSTVNWAEAGAAVNDMALGLLSMFRTAIQNVDWKQVGRDIKAFLSNIDWWGIIKEVAGLIKDIIAAAFDVSPLVGFALLLAPVISALGTLLGLLIKIAPLIGPMGLGLLKPAAAGAASYAAAAQGAAGATSGLGAAAKTSGSFIGKLGVALRAAGPAALVMTPAIIATVWALDKLDEAQDTYTGTMERAAARDQALIESRENMRKEAERMIPTLKNAQAAYGTYSDEAVIAFWKMTEAGLHMTGIFEDMSAAEYNRLMELAGAHREHAGTLVEQFEIAKTTYGEFSEEAIAAFEATLEAGVEWSEETVEAYRLAAIGAIQYTDDQIEALSGLGGEYETIEKQAADAFSRMNEETSVSLSEIADNLRENARITREWGDNTAELMQKAAELGVDEGVLKKFEEMAQRGPGYAEMLKNASNQELLELAELFGDSTDAAIGNVATRFNQDESVVRAAADLANNTTNSLRKTLEDANLPGMGADISGGIAKGIDDSAHIPMVAVAGVGEMTLEQFQKTMRMSSPSKAFEELGRGIMQGLANGIANNARLAVNAAVNMANAVQQATQRANESRSPSRVYEGFGRDMIEGLAVGIANSAHLAVDTIKSLAGTIVKTFGGVEYTPDIDYTALINEAVEAGDMLEAARLEQIRNAKIMGEGLQDVWEQAFDFQLKLGGADDGIDDLGSQGREIGASFLKGLQTTYNPILDFFRSLMADIQSVVSSALPVISPSIANVQIPKLSRGAIVDSVTVNAIVEKGRPSGAAQEQPDHGLTANLLLLKEEQEITNSLLRNLIEAVAAGMQVNLDTQAITTAVNAHNISSLRRGERGLSNA